MRRNLITLAALTGLTAAPVAAQDIEGRHPCPAAVDTTESALDTSTEPRFESADPRRGIYFRRILQVELADTVGPRGLCRILESADAVALMAWQPEAAVHALIRLREEPRSLEELEDRREAVQRIPGVRRAAKAIVPRLYWR
jgi:hypothetical protein